VLARPIKYNQLNHIKSNYQNVQTARYRAEHKKLSNGRETDSSLD